MTSDFFALIDSHDFQWLVCELRVAAYFFRGILTIAAGSGRVKKFDAPGMAEDNQATHRVFVRRCVGTGQRTRWLAGWAGGLG